MVLKKIGNINEVKTKKDIINIWRQLSLLGGIKEGSQQEWRCAKSYNNMAEYMIYGGLSEDEINSIKVIVFPIIRRLITGSGKKVTRVMTGEEIVEGMLKITMDDMLKYAKDKKRGVKSSVMFEMFKRFVEEYELGEKNIVELMNTFYAAKPEESISRTMRIFDLDIEAEICGLAIQPLRKILIPEKIKS